MANNGTKNLSDFRKKVSVTYGLINAAYHEAGHVIHGLLKGFFIDSAVIFQNKKNKKIEGITHYFCVDSEDLQDKDLFNQLLDAEICFFYAGLVAERLHFKEISGSDKFPLFLKNESSDDTCKAALLLRKRTEPGKKRYLFKKKMIHQTWSELIPHWYLVTVIAQALFKNKQLSFTEIKDLILSNADNKVFWKNRLSKISKIYLDKMNPDEQGYKALLNS